MTNGGDPIGEQSTTAQTKAICMGLSGIMKSGSSLATTELKDKASKVAVKVTKLRTGGGSKHLTWSGAHFSLRNRPFESTSNLALPSSSTYFRRITGIPNSEDSKELVD